MMTHFILPPKARGVRGDALCLSGDGHAQHSLSPSCPACRKLMPMSGREFAQAMVERFSEGELMLTGDKLSNTGEDGMKIYRGWHYDSVMSAQVLAIFEFLVANPEDAPLMALSGHHSYDREGAKIWLEHTGG
jgi:hypothetical protein